MAVDLSGWSSDPSGYSQGTDGQESPWWKKALNVGLEGLKTVGHPFQVPQSMIFAALGGDNPLKAIKDPYSYADFADVVEKNPVLKAMAKGAYGDNYQSHPGFKGLALSVDLVGDPLNFVGGLGAASKVAKGAEAAKTARKLGLTTEHIAELARGATGDAVRKISEERYGETLRNAFDALSQAKTRAGAEKVASEVVPIAEDASSFVRKGADNLRDVVKKNLTDSSLSIPEREAELLTKDPEKGAAYARKKVEDIRSAYTKGEEELASIEEARRAASLQQRDRMVALSKAEPNSVELERALSRVAPVRDRITKKEDLLSSLFEKRDGVGKLIQERKEAGRKIGSLEKRFEDIEARISREARKLKGLKSEYRELGAQAGEITSDVSGIEKAAKGLEKAESILGATEQKASDLTQKLMGIGPEIDRYEEVAGIVDALKTSVAAHPEKALKVRSDAISEIMKVSGLSLDDATKIVDKPDELMKIIWSAKKELPGLQTAYSGVEREVTDLGRFAASLDNPGQSQAIKDGMKAITDFYQRTGKLPDEASLADKLRAGWAGPGIHVPFTDINVQIPAVSEALARGIERIPKPVKEFGEKFSGWYGANVGSPARQMITKLLNPEYIKREIDVQGGRLGRELIEQSTASSAKVANAIDRTAENLIKEGYNPEVIKDHVQRVVDTIYENLPDRNGLDPTDLERILPELKNIVHSNVYTADMLPAWEKIGMEKDLYEKIFQKLSDAKVPDLAMRDATVLDKLFGGEKEAAKILNMPLEYTKGYLPNELRAPVLKALREEIDSGGSGAKFFSLFGKPNVWKHRNIVAPNQNFFTDALSVIAGSNIEDEAAQQVVESVIGKHGSRLTKWAEGAGRISVGEGEKAKDVFSSLDLPERYKIMRDYVVSHSTGDYFAKTRAEGWRLGYWSSPVTAEINRVSRDVGIKGLEAFKGQDIFLQDYMTRRFDRTNAYRRIMGKVGAPKAFSDWAVELGQGKRLAQLTGEEKAALREQGWKTPSVPGLKDYIYAPEVAKAMSQMENQTLDLLLTMSPKIPGIAGKAIKSLNGAWKMVTTAPFPSFHVRNVVTDMIKSAQAGVPFSDQARIMKAYQAPILKSIWTGTALTDLPDLRLANGAVFSGKDLAREIESRQVGRGFFAAEVIPEYERNTVEMTRFLKSAGIEIPKGWDKQPNKIYDFLGKMGNSSEGITRTTNFIYGLQKTGSPDEAMRLVNKINFDYEVVPEWIEKSQNIFPFIKYKYYNLPFQIEMAMKKPYVLRAFYHLRDISKREMLGENQDLETDYAKQNAMFYFPSNPIDWAKGKKGKILGAAAEGYFPFGEIENALPWNIPEEMSKLLTPFISGPIESVMNRQFFKPEKLIEEYPGQKTTLFGLPVSEKTKFWATKFLRPVQELDKLNPGGIFGTEEKPSLFGYVSPESYTKGVPWAVRAGSFFGAPKTYEVRPELEYRKRVRDNAMQLSDLRKEIQRVAALGEGGQTTLKSLIEQYRQASEEKVALAERKWSLQTE